jgi:hypothetical protein
VLAQSAAQLLQTLNKEFSASRLVQSACRESLRELNGCDYNCSNKFTVLLIFAPAYLPTFRPSSSRKMHVLSSMHCSHKMPGWRNRRVLSTDNCLGRRVPGMSLCLLLKFTPQLEV